MNSTLQHATMRHNKYIQQQAYTSHNFSSPTTSYPQHTDIHICNQSMSQSSQITCQTTHEGIIINHKTSSNHVRESYGQTTNLHHFCRLNHIFFHSKYFVNFCICNGQLTYRPTNRICSINFAQTSFDRRISS